jgi:predicted RNA-binding protein with PIN domain
MSSHLADVDPAVDVAVSDQMLLPLIEVAADVLRDLELCDVPPSVRPLHGFDRRGMLAGPAPRQLRRALVTDGAFRGRVVERFVARPEVGLVLAAWRLDNAAPMAAAAVECGDLALYTSALWAARPEGFAFGLGIAVVLDAQLRDRQRDTDLGKSAAQERAALEEAYRRAEAARIESDTALARAEQELMKERSARRAREDTAIGAAGAAQAQVDALRTELDQARAEIAEQQSRAARASARAHSLEDDLRRERTDSRVLQARAENAASRLSTRDERALADAVAVARQLSVSVDALQRRVRESAIAEGSLTDLPRARTRGREPAPTKRTHPRLPPGVVANSPAGVEAMLATPDVVLIVDGYNVAHRAWPEATAGDQRERLGIAATALCRRLGCEVVLVFDGNGSRPRPSLRRGGVRVLFSEAGEEADEVVVREVEARPRRIPVVVASSDAWVAEHARDQGAAVVGADALVRAIRPNH